LANRIWIDVEDLFEFKRAIGDRPSGIQRLEFELCRSLVSLAQSKDRVFFVRHDARLQRLTAIPWEAVEALYDSMSNGDRKVTSNGDRKVTSTGKSVLRVAKKLIDIFPPSLRNIVSLQIEVFLGLARVARAAMARARVLTPAARSEITPLVINDHFDAEATPGDTVASLGLGFGTDYISYIEKAVREKRLRFAVLIHDIIPLRRPEWYSKWNRENFHVWVDKTLSLADAILTNSTATAADVTAYARDRGMVLRAVPTPIPIGTGFTTRGAPSPGTLSSRLPPPNSYALFVSTIEVRKNHALLFRVWRRLLDDMSATSVPTLVFAGRVGWLVSDLMQQLRNCDFLGGKIIHIESPTDEELEALYAGCLFTLFPSFYEGWGLPVTESHAFGRPSIISNTTSLAEAGGSLARYIDPDNTTEAYRVIREAIDDRRGLREWRNRVRREFKPVEWSQSARAVLQALDATGFRARMPIDGGG
jgi:glycosyltransferase involved in cell wall biosynthesis